MKKFMKNINEALASILVAALVGLGSFLVCKWLINSYWGQAFDEIVYTQISVWAGVALGAVSGMMRWNVKK